MDNGNVTSIRIGLYTPTQYSFYVECNEEVPSGYSICVIGDFCGWKLSGANRLTYYYSTSTYKWQLFASLPNISHEYKYIISETDEPKVCLWEKFDGNRIMSDSKTVHDTVNFL